MFITLGFVLTLTLITCKKTPDTPSGNTKIDIGETTVDSISFYMAKVTTIVNLIGDREVIQHGHCWSKNNEPSVDSSKTSLGVLEEPKSYSSVLKNLESNTTYYLRPYLTYENGSVYGSENSFKTLEIILPNVTTSEVTNITKNSALCGGTVSNSDTTVIDRGICWNITGSPTLQNNLSHTSDGAGVGNFISEITDLTENTTYYVAAYATNKISTGYGEVKQFITNSILLPELSTTTPTNITENSAISGGNITSDGGAPVTSRGVCWSTTSNPTILNDHTSDGIGTGDFTSSITGIIKNTQYFLRAYATNNKGISYGNEILFTTISDFEVPTVVTNNITNITQNSATCGGNVISDGGTPVTACGVCWSTSPNPSINNNHTTDGDGTGTFTSSINALSVNTQYYLRAYAINSLGISYGNEVAFTTLSSPISPTVTTNNVTNITQNAATCGGNVTSDGGVNTSVRGICWSTSSNPTIADNHSVDGSGTGPFVSNITGLAENTSYYVRAYATNSVGTSYGDQATFVTLANGSLPVISTNSITNITSATATSGGNVSSNGGATVTARGVCWSTSSDPTISNNHTNDGTGLGPFTSNITGLMENTTYYLKAYATNSVGTSYGNQITFTTLANIELPAVNTDNATNITQTTATSGGNVTSNGGATVTARGVCWGTSTNPTLSNYYTIDGSGLGSFVSSLTGLTPSTLYYYRSYATNSAGTYYGNQFDFTTNGNPSTVFIDEGFDIDGDFPPGDWTQTIMNSNNTWTQTNAADNNFNTIDPNSLFSAMVPWVAENQDEWLYTPEIDAMGEIPLTLTVYVGISGPWLMDATLKCLISDDGGTTWMELWDAYDYIDPNADWEWYLFTTNLDDYATSEFQLAWQYVGNNGDLAGIDNIKIESNGKKIASWGTSNRLCKIPVGKVKSKPSKSRITR